MLQVIGSGPPNHGTPCTVFLAAFVTKQINMDMDTDKDRDRDLDIDGDVGIHSYIHNIDICMHTSVSAPPEDSSRTPQS